MEGREGRKGNNEPQRCWSPSGAGKVASGVKFALGAERRGSGSAPASSGAFGYLEEDDAAFLGVVGWVSHTHTHTHIPLRNPDTRVEGKEGLN